MTPSRLLRTSHPSRAEREALLERLGAVKGSLFLLASLPDCEEEPPLRPTGEKRQSASLDPRDAQHRDQTPG